MILYNKLVRDNIPDIIQKSGKTPAFHTLSENEYAICDARGYSTSELESCRKAKAEKRGSFANRIYLENVEDKNG